MERLLLLICVLTITMSCTSQPQNNTVRHEDTATATFAGGCFWCMEQPFEQVEGVEEVVSGFTGGDVANPSYEQVSSGDTEHVEAVQIHYDPDMVTYENLLDVYWRQIDPTDAGGQFADRGQQYTTAIFYHNETQRRLAEESKQAMQNDDLFTEPIVTPVKPFKEFYPAGDYHQDYYQNNPIKYKAYKRLSGRKGFIQNKWNDTIPDSLERDKDVAQEGESEEAQELTELQYEVTQEGETEPAFDNKYWNNTRAGIYVDIITGEPLFSSTHKYKSGTGWPSFYKPLEPENIKTETDYSLIYPRTEVKSAHGDNHLGHVFNDGPRPTGKRYCVNSAALEFIPKNELEERGYGEYTSLFENETDN